MKKTVFLATAAVLSGLMVSTVAMAAATYPANTGDADGKTATTNATVTLTKPSQNEDKPHVPGTDPKNPDTPVDPGNPSTAALKIVYASDFAFESKQISAKDQTANVLFDKTKLGNGMLPMVQVSDQRANGNGWNLNVKQESKFTNPKNSSDKILGASINFGTMSFLDDNDKATKDVEQGTQTSLSAGNEIEVMHTTTANHYGMYTGQFTGKLGTADGTTDKTTDGVKLDIPGNSALANSYATTLTWTLEDAPTK